MSIVRTFRRREVDGVQRLEYREAWFTPGAGEVVVHHGRVGTTGTTAAEQIPDDATGQELLAGFAAQCAEDGFTVPTAEQLQRLEIAYRLKGPEPTQVERGLAVKLRGEMTNHLAWRGLGEVVGERLESGQVVFDVHTPHRRKAAAQIPAAVKLAGVQASRVTTSA